MIYFISSKKYTNIKNEHNYIKFIDEEDFDGMVYTFFTNRKNNSIAFDVETTGLNPINDTITCEMYCDGKDILFIDRRVYNPSYIQKKFEKNIRYVGHNIKFDYSFKMLQDNIDYYNLHDIMIAEQRINQNLFTTNKLTDIVLRYTKKIPKEMNKELTNIFVNNPEVVITYELLMYCTYDVLYLLYIEEKQKIEIKKENLIFLLYRIEFPLIRVLSKMENEGFYLDVEKWKKLIEENKKLKFEYAKKLDEEFRRLRELNSFSEYYLCFKSGIWDKERKFLEEDYLEKLKQQKDLFGDTIKLLNNKSIKKVKKSASGEKLEDNYINWSSYPTLVKIFAFFSEYIPTKEQQYVIPELYIKNNVLKIKSNSFHFTTVEKELKTLITEKPNHRLKTFITYLLEYRAACTGIENFGLNYLNKINPKTNKIYTIYRQCFATTGRLQSGGGEKEKDRFNSQNIPTYGKYRECFYVEKGYELIMCDWSGAEAVIMGDKAKDYTFLKHKSDLHSFLGTASWKLVYKYRLDNYKYNEEEKKRLLEEYNNFEITKKKNTDKRTQFKAITFGIPYGAGQKTVAKALDIKETESELIINSFEKTIPKVMNNRKENVIKVVGLSPYKITGTGKLILNNRTNSRMYFSEVYIGLEYGKLDNKTYFKIANDCRNNDIQGTQADMIKEALVEIHYKYFEKNNLLEKGYTLMLNIHDEIVCKSRVFIGHDESFPLKGRETVTFYPDFPIPITEENLAYYGISKDKENQYIHIKYITLDEKNRIIEINCTVPKLISLVMNEVANRYLTCTKMESEFKTRFTWEK